VIDPSKNAVWHNEKGMFYLELKYYAAAIKEFRLAILLNPESEVSATFYNNLGTAYYKINYLDNAEMSFAKAVELRPYYLEYRENLIKTYKEKEMLKEVAEKHKKIIIEDPKNIQSYLMLGLIQKNYGNNEYAMIYLNKFIELTSDFRVSEQIKSIIKDLEAEKKQ